MRRSSERDVPTVIVVTRTGADVPMKHGRDIRYSDVRDSLATECEPEIMNAEDPLFILYTSGSTGKPKGVVHTTGGYAVWAATTFDWIFDYRPDDIFWCTADIGWITGHSYVVYGPLDDARDERDVRRRPQLSRFRPLLGNRRSARSDHLLHRADRDPSARARGRRVGHSAIRASRFACSVRSASRSIPTHGNGIGASSAIGRCPIVDTWWQTETGGILISPIPGRDRR